MRRREEHPPPAGPLLVQRAHTPRLLRSEQPPADRIPRRLNSQQLEIREDLFAAHAELLGERARRDEHSGCSIPLAAAASYAGRKTDL